MGSLVRIYITNYSFSIALLIESGNKWCSWACYLFSQSLLCTAYLSSFTLLALSLTLSHTRTVKYSWCAVWRGRTCHSSTHKRVWRMFVWRLAPNESFPKPKYLAGASVVAVNRVFLQFARWLTVRDLRLVLLFLTANGFVVCSVATLRPWEWEEAAGWLKFVYTCFIM